MTKVVGIVGWKDVGKTFFVTEIINLLVKKGYKVGTIKHAHHDFDIDKPGTDSFKHRQSGASEVIISSSKRWAKIIENNNKTEKKLNELLREFIDVDLVIVEGFKNESAYCASKHGLEGLMKSLAIEGSTSGIQVFTLTPGMFMNTPMSEKNYHRVCLYIKN